MKPRFIALWLSVGVLLENCMWNWNRPLDWNVISDRLFGIWIMVFAMWLGRKLFKVVES